jgi:hypothetical protein
VRRLRGVVLILWVFFSSRVRLSVIVLTDD